MLDTKHGLLANAAGERSSKAGSKAVVNRLAGYRTFFLNGVAIPFDVVPVQSDKQLVNLDTDSHRAATATLVISYEPRSSNEQVGSTAGEIPVPAPHHVGRDHVVFVQFGTGQAAHGVEIDVCEGTIISIPTESLDVSLYSYSIRPEALPNGARVDLESQASAAYLPPRTRAVKTMNALVPAGLFDFGDVGPLVRLRDVAPASWPTAFTAALGIRDPVPGFHAAFQAALDRIIALLPPP